GDGLDVLVVLGQLAGLGPPIERDERRRRLRLTATCARRLRERRRRDVLGGAAQQHSRRERDDDDTRHGFFLGMSGRGSGTKPFLFGIGTVGSVVWFRTVSSCTMSFR